MLKYLHNNMYVSVCVYCHTLIRHTYAKEKERNLYIEINSEQKSWCEIIY